MKFKSNEIVTVPTNTRVPTETLLKTSPWHPVHSQRERLSSVRKEKGNFRRNVKCNSGASTPQANGA